MAVQLSTQTGIIVPLNESPIGSETGYRAGYIGQQAQDITTGKQYVAIGESVDDWVPSANALTEDGTSFVNVTKPLIENAAAADLLAALVTLGLVVDDT